jgi:hypothetical protein
MYLLSCTVSTWAIFCLLSLCKGKVHLWSLSKCIHTVELFIIYLKMQNSKAVSGWGRRCAAALGKTRLLWYRRRIALLFSSQRRRTFRQSCLSYASQVTRLAKYLIVAKRLSTVPSTTCVLENRWKTRNRPSVAMLVAVRASDIRQIGWCMMCNCFSKIIPGICGILPLTCSVPESSLSQISLRLPFLAGLIHDEHSVVNWGFFIIERDDS